MKTQMEIIIVSRLAVELWSESIQRGAYDYLPKALDKADRGRTTSPPANYS